MIRKIVLTLFFILNTALLFAQQTLFVDKKYEEALVLAKVENKPLVIMFYATWCPHCNAMKKEIFTDNAVVDFYSQKFICMAVDSESAYGKELKTKFQNKFRVTSFPTFAFLDGNETLLYCMSGEFKKEKFLSEGNDALLPENQLPNVKKAFFEDTANADKCLKLIISLRKAGIDATPVAQKYLANLTPEQKYTEINWRVFSNGINNFDNDDFKYVIQNRDAFAKAISASRVDKKINYTISENLRPLVERFDTINYNKKHLLVESFHTRKTDSLLYRFDLQMLPQTSDWKKYQKLTFDNVEQFSLNDPAALYDICITYYESIDDKTGLLKALEWSKHLLSKGETIERYILTSKLLKKLKNYKQAAEFAQKGKAFTDNLGLKNEELDKLLEEIKKA